MNESDQHFNLSAPLVEAATLADEATEERFRRDFYDFIHINGWNKKTLHDAYNQHRESLSKSPLNYNVVMAALNGARRHRPLARRLEFFCRANSGPHKHEA